MALIDTFTDTNPTLLTAHTSDSGHGWAQPSVVAGQFTIVDAPKAGVDSMAYCSTVGAVYSDWTPAYDDYDVTYTLYQQGNLMAAGVLVRFDPATGNGYRIEHVWSSTTIRLRRYNAGTIVATDIASGTYNLTNGNAATFRAEVRGDTFSLYLVGTPDTLIFSGSDATYSAAGRVAVWGGQAGTSLRYFDSISTVDVAPPQPPVVDAGADATATIGVAFARTATFTDADSAGPFTATVDYGDGAGPVAATVDQVNKTVALSRTWTSEGDYTVTVEVTDDGGASGSDSFTVTVSAAPAAITKVWTNGEWVSLRGRQGPPGELVKAVADTYYAAKGPTEAATLGMPTVVTSNYTRHLSRYASLAAAIADLPDAGANGGEVRIDGEVPVASIAGTVPAGVTIAGRGSQVSAVVVPAGHASPVLDIDGASGVTVAGLAGIVEGGGDAAHDGILVRIRGDLDDVLIEDVRAENYDHVVNVEGWAGTVPGTVRGLTLRRVHMTGSPVGAGINLDDVDGYTLIDCESTFNALDGLKLRRMARNGQIFGGRFSDNGGGGINGYAGADGFTAHAVEAARNNSNGFALKAGPLNTGTDEALYGNVRRISITDPRCYENGSSGIDVVLASESIADLAAPLMAEVSIVGGELRENGANGLNTQARNATITNVHAIRNAQDGFYAGNRSMDTRFTACVAIGNGQSAAGTYSGFLLGGESGSLVNCLSIGTDSDDIGQDSDYSALTKYQIYGYRWASTAKGVWRMSGSESRHHSASGNGVRIDSTAGSYLFDMSGTGRPDSTAVYGGVGSTYRQTGAASEDAVLWVKWSGASNAALAGWRRAGSPPRVTALPTAAATYKGVMLVKDNAGASEDTLHICVQTGASTYAWKQVTLA